MRSLKPWLRITDLRQERDRLFDRVFESRSDEFPATGDWVPRLDLSETSGRAGAEDGRFRAWMRRTSRSRSRRAS